MSEFYAGQRVTVPMTNGERAAGTVAYVRMAGPDYRTAQAVSVILDARKDVPNYTGSVYFAGQVEPLPDNSRQSVTL